MNVPELHEVLGLTVNSSAVSMFNQVSPATVMNAQAKDSVLGLVIPYMCRGEIQKAQPFPKLDVRQHENTCSSLIDW